MTAIIEVHQLVRQFGDFTAVAGIDFEVEEGEFFGFLGPNGAGKTTAMHLAIGLMFPSRGRGAMLGHEFGHAPTRRRVVIRAVRKKPPHRTTEEVL